MIFEETGLPRNEKTLILSRASQKDTASCYLSSILLSFKLRVSRFFMKNTLLQWRTDLMRLFETSKWWRLGFVSRPSISVSRLPDILSYKRFLKFPSPSIFGMRLYYRSITCNNFIWSKFSILLILLDVKLIDFTALKNSRPYILCTFLCINGSWSIQVGFEKP